MKKLILLFLVLLFSHDTRAQQAIHTFDDLMNALKSGKNVNAVINYGKCKLFSDGKEQPESPQAIGGMQLQPFEYFDSSVFKGKVPSFVTSSQTLLINHHRYGYVYNYVKIKIRKDNTIEITARYLRPRRFSAKYKVVMDETFKCTMNDGTNDGAVNFYAD